MDDHRGYWLSLVRSDRRKLCTASFWGRQSGGAVVWFHSLDVSPKKPERPWDGPETAYREDNKRLALLTHSRDRTGCGLLVPYRTQTGSLTDRHVNCGRRGDHHALSLAGEEKDRKRSLLRGLLVEYFLGLWWVDYLATGFILAFVAREAVESYHELHGQE